MREKGNGLNIYSEKIKVRIVLLFGESQILFVSHQGKNEYLFFSSGQKIHFLNVAYKGRVKDISFLYFN